MLTKKQLFQDLIPPPSIYIHTCTLYTYENAEIESIRILRALQVSHPDSWAHIQLPHLCSVCVCVRIHTNTHPYTPTCVENREDTDNTPIFLSVKNNPPRQVTSSLFAYLWIGDSLIRTKVRVGSLIRWFSSMCFHFDQEGCCPCCNSLS